MRSTGCPWRERGRARAAADDAYARQRTLSTYQAGSTRAPARAGMTTYEGRLDAAALRFAIVVSRFNETITRQLLEGARDCLRRHGADDRALGVAWVPGAFEIPLAAQRLARSGQYDAVICLGAVIRGATAHFEHVAGQAA